MLQILSLFFGIIARRPVYEFKDLIKIWCKKYPSRVIHNKCASCASPARSNPQEISKVTLFHSCAHTQQKSVFSLTLTLIQTLSQSDAICPTNRKNQDSKQGKGNKHLATQHFGPNSTCTAPTENKIWATFASRLSPECVSIVIEMKKGISFWTFFHWSDLSAQPMSSDQK